MIFKLNYGFSFDDGDRFTVAEAASYLNFDANLQRIVTLEIDDNAAIAFKLIFPQCQKFEP